MERRLAANLAADVVGYSRMIRANEESTIAALKALHADLVDPKIAEHHESESLGPKTKGRDKH